MVAPPASSFESDRYGVDEVYPNPATDYVDVVYHTEHPLPVEITIYDMKGKPVVKEKLGPNENEKGNGVALFFYSFNY